MKQLFKNESLQFKALNNMAVNCNNESESITESKKLLEFL